jgi:hypothetical protein
MSIQFLSVEHTSTQTAKTKDISTFYFPLRTNMHFFDSPSGHLSLKDRVKQAALLYDDTLFEAGTVLANIWPTGSTEIHLPARSYAPEERERNLRNLAPGGQEAFFQIAFGESEHSIMHSGVLSRQFYAEFETIYDEMAKAGCDWIGLSYVDFDEETKKIASQIGQKEFVDVDAGLLQNSEHFVRQTVLNYASHDLLCLAATQLPASTDPFFAQLWARHLRKSSQQDQPTGFLTLDATVPNFALLPWDVIIKVRKMPAIAEFRQKMTETEALVRANLPSSDPRDIMFEIRGIFNDELMDEVNNSHSLLSKSVSGLSMDLIGGLLSLPIAPVVTLAQTLTQYQESRRGWLAVQHRLRRRW